MTLDANDEFQNWVPKIATKYAPNVSDGYDRWLYLFLGWKFGVEDISGDGTFRWINNVENLGPGVPPP